MNDESETQRKLALLGRVTRESWGRLPGLSQDQLDTVRKEAAEQHRKAEEQRKVNEERARQTRQSNSSKQSTSSQKSDGSQGKGHGHSH